MPGVTFSRGNTLTRNDKSTNWTYDKWDNWPSIITTPTKPFAYNDTPVVNVVRELANATSIYRLPGNLDTLYAEI